MFKKYVGDRRGVTDTLVASRLHESGHALLQPPMLSATAEDIQSYARGETPPADPLTRNALTWGVFHEGQADLFSMGMSLNPQSVASFRYRAGVLDVLQSARPGELSGWRYGDAIPVRVINPESVEPAESPLYKLIHQYASAYEQRLKNELPNTGNLMADASAAVIADSVLQRHRVFTSRRHLIDASTGSLKMEGLEPFYVTTRTIASDVVKSMIQDYRAGALEVDDADTRELLRYGSTRMWTIGYVVGKTRPDLIGEELKVSPDEIRVASTGERIELKELPDLEIMGFGSKPEMHPLQLHWGLRALDLYNRAREAIRRGIQFQPPEGASGSDVVRSWRQIFSENVGA